MRPAAGGNETIGLNGNDTIGAFGGIGVGPGGTAGGKLDMTEDANNTLNFYVTALKKEENQKSETGGEEYMDTEALSGKNKNH